MINRLIIIVCVELIEVYQNKENMKKKKMFDDEYDDGDAACR